MRIMEREREEIRTTRAATRPTSRTWMLTAAIAVLALVAGGVIGWFARGEDDPRILPAGEADLTPRQEQIIEFIDEYVEAWNDADVEALVGMYTDNGRLTTLGRSYPVAEPAFADFVEMEWTIVHLDPVLVRGNEVLSFHLTGDGSSGGGLVNVITLTPSGELLIVEHQILD